MNGGIQDPERKKQGKKQDGNPGLQEIRLEPVKQAAWKSPMGGGSWREDGSSKAGYFSWIISSMFKNDPSP